MTFSFLCRASKASKNGLCPIEFSININGERKYVTTNRKVKASSFNPRTQKVYNDNETNDYLAALRAKLYAQETEMLKRGIVITIDTFMDIYKNGFEENTITLLQLFKKHNEQFEKKIKSGVITDTTLYKYTVTMRYLSDYLKTLKKQDIMVKDITPMFIEDLFVHLLTTQSNNTAIQKMKQLKKILRMAVEEGYIKTSPFKLDTVKLATMAEISRNSLLQYLQYLADARLINLLYSDVNSVKRLQKPDKIYLDNPNLLYALSSSQVNEGTLREVFFVNQLSVNHTVEYSKTAADFTIDHQYTIEVGGHSKDGRQIASVADSFIAAADEEYVLGNKIPLWLFGFLY